MVRTTTLLSTTLALLFLLPSFPMQAGDAVLTGSESHRVIDARITPEALVSKELDPDPSVPFTLPKLWVYDDQGREIWAKEGFDADTFPQSMETALRSPSPDPEAPRLGSRLEDFTTPDGEPLGPLPPARATVVKYWADWCQPCKRQSKLLSEVLARHPETSLNVLQVEADPSKLEGVILPGVEAPVRVISGELDPETKEKLRSGELSPEEAQALLEELGAAGEEETP